MGTEVVFSLLVVVLLITGAIVALIFPAWLLFRCLGSTMPSSSKTMWTLSMILAWPFGSFLYGMRAGTTKVKRYSLLALIVMVLFIGGALMAVPYFLQKSQIVLDNAIKEFDKSGFLGLPDESRIKLKAALSTLKEELGGSWLSNVEEKQHAIAMLQLLEHYASDDKIDEKESKDWHEKFEMRKLITAQAILEPMLKQNRGSEAQVIAPLPPPEKSSQPERPVPE